jgi:hypothetical protein
MVVGLLGLLFGIVTMLGIIVGLSVIGIFLHGAYSFFINTDDDSTNQNEEPQRERIIYRESATEESE